MINALLAKRISEISKHDNKATFLAFRHVEDEIIWEAKAGKYHIRIKQSDLEHDYLDVLAKLVERGYTVDQHTDFAVIRWK